MPGSQVLPEPWLGTTVYTFHPGNNSVPCKEGTTGMELERMGPNSCAFPLQTAVSNCPKQRPRQRPRARGSGTCGEFQCQKLRHKNPWLVQSQISRQNKIFLPATDSPGSRLNTNPSKANLQNAHCALKGTTVRENGRKPGRQSSRC